MAPSRDTWGLLERLSSGETALVRDIASQPGAPSEDAVDCARTLKRLRYDRERAALQRDIDRLQERGATDAGDELNALLRRKQQLQRIGHTEGFTNS